MSQKAVGVIGDGWAALGAVGFLSSQNIPVRWFAGTGAKLCPPLPTFKQAEGVSAWIELAKRYGLDAGEPQVGSFLREFRNKAFREPLWTKAPTPEARESALKECISWSAERQVIGSFEIRCEISLGDLEEQLRKKIAEAPGVTRVVDIPVQELMIESGAVQGVILGSGEKVELQHVIFADRWSSLVELKGLPKLLPFARNRHPVSALQATFQHEARMGEGLREGFFGAPHKEPGEELERNIWGYFLGQGNRSVWTLYLTSEELEDNHEIAKKLRRMKQTLDRMFSASGWLPPGKETFMSTVTGEQVRFEESLIFSSGKSPEAPIHLEELSGLAFLTDGYGPASALRQAELLMKEILSLELAPVQVSLDQGV
jgi:hypothetical protein